MPTTSWRILFKGWQKGKQELPLAVPKKKGPGVHADRKHPVLLLPSGPDKVWALRPRGSRSPSILSHILPNCETSFWEKNGYFWPRSLHSTTTHHS